MTFRKDSRGQAKNTRALLRYNYCHPMFLLQSTNLKACNFIERYTIYKREKKGPKRKFNSRHISAFPSHFPVQFNFHSNSFSFFVRFCFFPFTHEQDEHVRPHRRADRIRPPPPSDLRIPTPPSFTPLVLSDLPTLFPLSVVPC